MTPKELFEEKIGAKIKENPDKIKSVQAIYEFQVTGDIPATWTLDLTTPGGKVFEGSSGNAKCTVTIAFENLVAIVEKKLNPQMAFMTGKLKVTGDMGLALKLGTIL